MTKFYSTPRVPQPTDAFSIPSARPRWKALAGVFALALLMCGHAAENQPPFATLGIASQGTSSSQVITLLGTATDPDGQIRQVDFYEGEQWLATAWAPPFNLDLRALNRGPFDWTFRIIATDDQGRESSVPEATLRGSDGELPESIIATVDLALCRGARFSRWRAFPAKIHSR